MTSRAGRHYQPLETPQDAANAGFRIAVQADWEDMGACATCANLRKDHTCVRLGLDLAAQGMSMCSDYQARPGRPRRVKYASPF